MTFVSRFSTIMTSLPFSLQKCVCLIAMTSLLVGCVFSETECNHTITKRAWFDIYIKDYEGPGEDFHGRFVIGLFGEVAPATVLNFASIANGYKHGKVRNKIILHKVFEKNECKRFFFLTNFIYSSLFT